MKTPQGVSNRAPQLFSTEWFGNNPERFQVACFALDVGVQLGRHQDAGQDQVISSQPANDLQAGQFGHVHVDQHHVNVVGMHDLESFFAIAGQKRPKPLRLKKAPQGFPQFPIVVGDQDGRQLHSHNPFTRLPLKGRVQGDS